MAKKETGMQEAVKSAIEKLAKEYGNAAENPKLKALKDAKDTLSNLGLDTMDLDRQIEEQEASNPALIALAWEIVKASHDKQLPVSLRDIAPPITDEDIASVKAAMGKTAKSMKEIIGDTGIEEMVRAVVERLLQKGEATKEGKGLGMKYKLK